MRRPILAFLFAEAFGIAAAVFTHIGFGAAALGGAFLIAAAFYLERRGRLDLRGAWLLPVIISFFVLGLTGGCLARDRCSHMQAGEGEVVSVEGTVSSVSVRDGRSYVTLKCGSENVLIRISTDNEKYIYSLPGRRLSAAGEVSFPEKKRNPGCFDYDAYLRGKNTYLILDVSPFRCTAGRTVRPVLNFLSVKKGQFYSLLRQYSGEEKASVISALLFGDKGYMDDGEYASFQDLGIAHVLAVSGLHVSLLYSSVQRLLGGGRSRFSSVLSITVIAAYCALCNFSVSVLRASFMTLLKIISVPLGKKYDSLSAAAFCCIVFITVRPYLLFSSGTQLSFLAAFGSGAVSPYFEVLMLKASDKAKSAYFDVLAGPAVSALSMQFVMLPAVIFHFTVFSPLSLIFNPAAVFLAGLLLPFGLLCFWAVSAFGIEGAVFAGLSGPAGAAAELLLKLGGFGASADHSCPAPPAGLVILFYVLVFWFFSETRVVLRRRTRRPLYKLSSVIMLSACFVPFFLGITGSPFPWKYDTHILTFLDVGQGDCIHISYKGKNILIDGGGNFFTNTAERTLKPYLLKNGISKVDMAIVTHLDNDHCRGIQQLAEIFPVDRVFFSEVYSSSPPEGFGTSVGYLREGEVINIGDGLALTVLYPFSDMQLSEESNENSLVLRLDSSYFSALFTGDLGIEGEDELIRKGSDLSADILKAGHHGSAGSTGEGFLSEVSPSFAVISCGKNNSYGHPSDRVVDLLADSGIIYSRTDLSGAVYIKRFRRKLVIESVSGREKWHISTETDNQESIPPKQW